MANNLIYDYLSDAFEVCEWNESSLYYLGNSIIYMVDSVDNPDEIEAMLNALCSLILVHGKTELLNIDLLLKSISKLDTQSLEHLCYILSYTGNKKYLDVLNKIKQFHHEEYVDAAINELIIRINNN